MNAKVFSELGRRAGEVVLAPRFQRSNLQGHTLYKYHKELFASDDFNSTCKDDEDAVEKHGIKPRRKEYFAALAMTTLRFDRQQKKVRTEGRKFLLIKSKYMMETFLKDIPMTRRIFAEMIFTDTPHRFFMDIEQDKFEEGTDVTVKCKEMEDYLVNKFIPILAGFFNDTFGTSATPADFAITIASDHTKFSAHVMLADGSYFATRVESWIAAGALAKHLSDLAKTDDELNRFYSVIESNPNGEKVVDYSVYGKGTRNMRMLGSVSYKGDVPLRTHWTKMRPLLSHASCEHQPWVNFIASVNHAPRSEGFRKLEVDPEIYRSIKEFINQESTRSSWIASKMSSLTFYLGGSQGYIVSRGLSTHSSIDSNRPMSEYNDQITRDLGDIMKRVMKLGDPDRVTGHDAEQRQRRADEQKAARDSFFEAGKKMAFRMASLIHPQQTIRELEADISKGQICRLAVSAFVNGPHGPLYRMNERGQQKRQRMCLWSFDKVEGVCQGGTNQVEITVLADFSMVYFCHTCKKRDVAVFSPIRPRTVTPILYYQGIPNEFRGIEMEFIDYSKSLEDSIEVNPFMKPIEALDNYHMPPDKQRTILLHGGMGTGKSTVVEKWLIKARKEIQEREGREVRILSLCFRQMLARNLAAKWDLVVYNDEEIGEESLSTFPQVSCQVDSIKKCGEREEPNDFRIQPYDIVILDESESVLSHMSSRTLERRRGEVFGLIKMLIKHAHTLIAADADMGRRTFEFIRRVRNIRGENHFLCYHRNPFVRKDTHFIDYKFMNTWMTALEDSVIIKKKRVFLVSNNKAKLKSVCRYIRKRLDEMTKTLESGTLSQRQQKELQWRKNMQIDPEFIKIIDGDMNGAEKTTMAQNCNEEWSKYRLLAITPVVGAGISFDKENVFHEAFLLATPSSCPPRGITQLLGRVRHLIDNRVRVFIDDSVVIGKGKTLDEDSIYSELRRDNRSLKSARLDMMSARVENDGTIVYSIQNEDDLLLRVNAMNVEEERKGKNDFRAEFIQVLQKNNPSINYTFNLNGTFNVDTKVMKNLRVENDEIADLDIVKVAIQGEEQETELTRVKIKNDRGQVCFEDDEYKQENVTSIINKNRLKHMLGIVDGTDDRVYEAYHTIIGIRQDSADVIERCAKFLFTSIYELHHSQAEFMEEFRFRVGDNPRVHVVKEKVTQGLDPLDYRVKYWLRNLLYIGGFINEAGPEPVQGFSINNLEGHSSLMKDRVDNDDTQAWLKKHIPPLVEQLEITATKTPPKPKSDARIQRGERQWKQDDYSIKSVTWIIKSLFRSLFQLETSSTAPDGSVNACQEHGTKCRINKPNEQMFRVMCCMAQKWLETQDQDLSWVKESSENAKAVCEAMCIHPLPGMAAQGGETEMEEEEFIEFASQFKIEGRKRNEQTLNARRKKSKKRKRGEDEKKSPEEKFEEKWARICELHIGVNMYKEKDAVVFLSKILSEGYKFRTKKEMIQCYQKMNSNREKLMALRNEQ